MTSAERSRMLDNDFLFYLDFSKDYRLRLTSENERRVCRKWLEKLCTETAFGVEGRKIRNIWVAHLVICIQRGSLSSIFLNPPGGGPLPEYPDRLPQTVETPAWLDVIRDEDVSSISRDGRTYLATQNLDNGRGAFAYVAVTLNDGEPEWLPQAGRQKLEDVLAHGFEYAMGDLSQPDLAAVLASRKTIDQRRAVLEYYNNILENIDGQLTGIIEEASSDIVNDLIIRLVKGLRREGNYQKYKSLPTRERYFRLLENLSRKIKRRIGRIERRELLLDEVERRLLGDSLLSETFAPPAAYAGPDWWDSIPADTSDERMQKVKYLYPPEVTATLRELLEKEKWSLGARARRQHIDFEKQLREDLHREQHVGEVVCDEHRAAVAELEAAVEVGERDVRAALTPIARSLAKDIKETEALLEKLNEEYDNLAQIATELATKVN